VKTPQSTHASDHNTSTLDPWNGAIKRTEDKVDTGKGTALNGGYITSGKTPHRLAALPRRQCRDTLQRRIHLYVSFVVDLHELMFAKSMTLTLKIRGVVKHAIIPAHGGKDDVEGSERRS
jgi:hypothetical protein